jgi:hypothetical protein
MATTGDLLGCANMWVEVKAVRDILLWKLQPYIDLWLEVDLFT